MDLLELIFVINRIPARSSNLTTRAISTPKLIVTDSGLGAEPVQLFHYRDRDQVEVDMVLEHAAGAVIGVAVKAAETVRAEDFRGLRHLANRLSGRFRPGSCSTPESTNSPSATG